MFKRIKIQKDKIVTFFSMKISLVLSNIDQNFVRIRHQLPEVECRDAGYELRSRRNGCNIRRFRVQNSP